MMHRQRRAATVVLSATILLAQSALPQQPPKQPAASSNKKRDPFFNGAPLTLEQVVRYLQAISPQRLKEAIVNRGLNFSLTFDNLAKLKAAGVTGEILAAIREHAKPELMAPVPVLPPSPPPPKTGGLLITCSPAECEIGVGGEAKGTTQGGMLRISGLSLGSVPVDFKKNGYIGSQSLVTIEADKLSPLNATLEPTQMTKEGFGAQLFKNMVQALGGEAAIRAVSVQAEGGLTSWAPNGKNTRWTILMRNRPDRGLLQIKGSGSVFHEVAFEGSRFTTSKSLKGDDARELPADFGLVRDHQIARLIARLSTREFKMVSNNPERIAGQNPILVAEGSTETISINLDNDSRPAQVSFSTGTGLGSAIVTYSDYLKTDEIYYPRSIQIKLVSHGVDVHFDKLELNPKLKDSDYELKKKVLGLF
jgi:hypothetical protein